MYYGKTQLDDFIGLDDFGWLGKAAAKAAKQAATSCPSHDYYLNTNGKCVKCTPKGYTSDSAFMQCSIPPASSSPSASSSGSSGESYLAPGGGYNPDVVAGLILSSVTGLYDCPGGTTLNVAHNACVATGGGSTGTTNTGGGSSINNISCPAGSGLNTAGKCVKCKAGTSAAAGANACTPCAAESYAKAGAAACTPCPSGYYSAGGTGTCKKCGKNTSDANCTSTSGGGACSDGSTPNSSTNLCTNGTCPTGLTACGSPATSCVAPGTSCAVTPLNVGTCSDGSTPTAAGLCANGTCAGSGVLCNGQCLVAGSTCATSNTGTCVDSTGLCAAYPGTVYSNGSCVNCTTNVATGCTTGFVMCNGVCQQGTVCPQVTSCNAGQFLCNGACVPLGTVCNTGGQSTCPGGEQIDYNPSSPTYGQCIPLGTISGGVVPGGAGGGGGGMPGSPDGSQTGAPGSAVADASEAAPAPKSNKWLYVGLGLAVVGGLYLYSKHSKKGKKK